MMRLTSVRIVLSLVLASVLASCAPRAASVSDNDVFPIGDRYAKLVLAMGIHDPNYVDAYYGPPEWKLEAERDSIPLPAIIASAESLIARLNGPPPKGGDSGPTRYEPRIRFLRRQLEALVSHARMLGGTKLSFDEESQALYDAVAPQRTDESFAPALARLDSLLPGKGTLSERWDRYREEFVMPVAKLDTVFKVALAEARRRTRAHLALPDTESFTVEFVKGTPWSGYNWYQGNYRSLIQINTDLPIYIDRALDLACHEGYPGHHVYGVLLEKALVRENGWREFTVYPLNAPQALIAEGTAVVATEVAFPADERVRFEKNVLCPLLGIDTTRFLRYAAIRDELDELSMAGVEGARRWLDGKMSREEAKRWLMKHAVRTEERADKDLRFAERYRSYLVSYRLGKELVLDWLAANGGDVSHPERRWELYQSLLASPRLPSDLRTAGAP